MRRYHRLALAACLAAACLLFLPAPTARAQGAEVTDLTGKSGVIELRHFRKQNPPPVKGGDPMRRQHRLALAACLTAACLLFLPAPTARARGAEVTDLTRKSSVKNTHDTSASKIPRW